MHKRGSGFKDLSSGTPLPKRSISSLSIRRFWGKRGKTEAKKGESWRIETPDTDAFTVWGEREKIFSVSLSVFSLVQHLLFDCSRVLEYAKIRTVLQSNSIPYVRSWLCDHRRPKLTFNTRVLYVNLLCHKRIGVALQRRPLIFCMKNRILKSANAKYHYFYFFFQSIKWIKETFL